MQVVVEQQVLGLQVAMYNLVAMAVLDGADDLLEELACAVLGHLAMVDDVVEQLRTSILEDHDNLCRCSDDGEELDDVRMSQELQILDLPLDSAGHVASDEFAAGDDLEGDLLAGGLVDGELDLAEAALAERLEELILAQAGLCGLLTLLAVRRALAPWVIRRVWAVRVMVGGAWGAVGEAGVGI